MAFDLTTFSLGEMLRCGLDLRRRAGGAATMEEAAEAVVSYLYGAFTEPGTDRPACALVRFYVTQPYEALEPALQVVARRALGKEPPRPDMTCLTLLATVGDEPEWRSRRSSKQHRVIPLASTAMVEQAPMIAQLIREFGLDIGRLVRPSRDVVQDLGGKTYGVFHVETAPGSPSIPAQQEFVAPYGIRSVVGFGGSLRTDDLFAVVMFSRVHVPHESADRFRAVALDVKAVVFPFDSDRIFAPERRPGVARPLSEEADRPAP